MMPRRKAVIAALLALAAAWMLLPTSQPALATSTRPVSRTWTHEDSAAFVVPGSAPRRIRGQRGGDAPFCLPSFFILGAAKCGTTTLAALLNSAPTMSHGAKKEHMFVRNPERGASSYAAGFGPCGEAGVRVRYFDADPRALHLRTNATALRALFTPAQQQRLQFLVSLCDPVGRTYSHYYMDKAYSAHRNFADVHGIADPNEFVAALLNGSIPDDAPQARTDGYLHHSFYHRTLTAWAEAFPTSRFLFLEATHWQPRQAETLARVADFLGLGDVNYTAPDRPLALFSNAAHQTTPFTDATREALKRLYSDDSVALRSDIAARPQVELYPPAADTFFGGLYQYTEEARHPAPVTP